MPLRNSRWFIESLRVKTGLLTDPGEVTCPHARPLSDPSGLLHPWNPIVLSCLLLSCSPASASREDAKCIAATAGAALCPVAEAAGHTHWVFARRAAGPDRPYSRLAPTPTLAGGSPEPPGLHPALRLGTRGRPAYSGAPDRTRPGGTRALARVWRSGVGAARAGGSVYPSEPPRISRRFGVSLCD
jgi:hypothetical protein